MAPVPGDTRHCNSQSTKFGVFLVKGTKELYFYMFLFVYTKTHC